MRNFSLISILLALAAGVLIWQKLIVSKSPENLPQPASYTSSPANYNEQEVSTAPDAAGGSGFESDEQQEMADQQSRSHDIMMKSFDQKYDKYKDQINGQ